MIFHYSSQGDTWPVGCKPAPSVVYVEESFEDNPDMKDGRYNTELGIYSANCGIENVLMSWGHDEYMYWVLKENGCTVPEDGPGMIRFQSSDPWHDKRACTHLKAPEDLETLKRVK